MKVLHELPGRIRLLVPGLWRQEDAPILCGYLESLDGIIECTANHRRSSVLVVYDPERIKLEHIQFQIDFIMAYLQTSPQNEKYSLLAALDHDSLDLQDNQAGAAKKVIAFSLIYLLYKWKQAKFGKFAISRSVPWMQVASLVTIIGGYPLLKTYYKKYTRELPGDSEDMLKQASVFFTLVRESAKGVFVLALKTMNDWLKFSADINNYRQWQSRQGNVCRLYAVEEQDLWRMLPEDKLQQGEILALSAGQLVPVRACVIEGEATVMVDNELRACKCGDYIKAGSIIRGGQIKMQLVKNGKPREKLVVDLDDVHQPETVYQWGITRVALFGAAVSYIITRSSLSALAVLLVMSPSAGNAAVSSGLNNCVYRFSRKNVLVPDPNCLMGISECRQVVIHKELVSKDLTEQGGEKTAVSVIDELEGMGVNVSILVDQADRKITDYLAVTFITHEDYCQQRGPSILVSSDINGEHYPDAYTVLMTDTATEEPADIMVFGGRLRDLPDILKEIRYARKVISQSVFFTQAFNIWYGANAIFKPFDAFAAKSLNTTNSLAALLSNQRILAAK